MTKIRDRELIRNMQDDRITSLQHIVGYFSDWMIVRGKECIRWQTKLYIQGTFLGPLVLLDGCCVSAGVDLGPAKWLSQVSSTVMWWKMHSAYNGQHTVVQTQIQMLLNTGTDFMSVHGYVGIVILEDQGWQFFKFFCTTWFMHNPNPDGYVRYGLKFLKPIIKSIVLEWWPHGRPINEGHLWFDCGPSTETGKDIQQAQLVLNRW